MLYWCGGGGGGGDLHAEKSKMNWLDMKSPLKVWPSLSLTKPRRVYNCVCVCLPVSISLFYYGRPSTYFIASCNLKL